MFLKRWVRRCNCNNGGPRSRSRSFPAARAIAYSEPSCCSDGFQTGKLSNDVEERRTAIGMDYVRRTVLVEVSSHPPLAPFLCRRSTGFFVCAA